MFVLQALTRVFGSRNDRLVKNYTRLVRDATALEPRLAALSDEALRARTGEFRVGCSRARNSTSCFPRPLR